MQKLLQTVCWPKSQMDISNVLCPAFSLADRSPGHGVHVRLDGGAWPPSLARMWLQTRRLEGSPFLPFTRIQRRRAWWGKQASWQFGNMCSTAADVDINCWKTKNVLCCLQWRNTHKSASLHWCQRWMKILPWTREWSNLSLSRVYVIHLIVN